MIGNFNIAPQSLGTDALKKHGCFQQNEMKNLCSGMRILAENDTHVMPPLTCYWLTD